jgi:hypothetical protein
LASSAAVASGGSGRAKNSDLLNRHVAGVSTASSSATASAPRLAQKCLDSANDICTFDAGDGSAPALSTNSRSLDHHLVPPGFLEAFSAASTDHSTCSSL